MSFLTRSPKLTLSITIIAVGMVLGIAFQYELFSAYLWTLAGLALAVPFTLIVGLIALGFLLASWQIGKGLRYTLTVGCSLVVSLLVFFATGSLINKWKVDALDSYVARAIPVLDQIKQKEGSYPAKLPTDILGEPPELLKNFGDYSATQNTYRFEYVNEPAGWAGGEGALEFDNVNRKWTNDR